MCKQRFCLIALVVAPCIPAYLSGQESVLEGPGLRGYVREVLAQNEGLAAARSRVAAAGERIAPAGALTDPTVTLGLIAVPTPSFDFTAERMTRLPVGFRQRFPFPGTLASATDRARADSALAGESLAAIESRLVAEAAGAFYELAYAETAVRIWQARVALANQAIAVAQTRYETGAAPQTDLLRARLRRAQLEEEGWEREALVTQARARGDALRAAAADPITALVLVGPDGQSMVMVGRDSLSEERLAAQLMVGNPDIRVAAALIARAERHARVFDIAGRPAFTVGIESGLRFGGREPFTTALVGITVPLWSKRKQAPAARAAHFDLDASRQQHDDLVARLIGELRDRIARLMALRSQITQTADEIIPLAGAAAASALQRYQVGAVEFTTVLETQDATFAAHLRMARLITDYASTHAQLGALVGEEWYR